MKYLYYNLTGRTVSVDEDIFELKLNKNSFDDDFENMKNEFIEETNEGIYMKNILCIESDKMKLNNIEDFESYLNFYCKYYSDTPIFILDNKNTIINITKSK